MPTKIETVAVACATGLMSTPILSALLASNFNVTILTRQDSTATFPPEVKVIRVDYTSHSSLVSALKGIDAVASALTHLAIAPSESALIDAAVEAGVRRFLPSEYGSDTTNPVAATFPLYAGKVASTKKLEGLAAANPGFTWTSVVTGPLLGWIAAQAFFNPREKTAKLYDGGGREFSVATREVIGKAVVGVLTHAEETKNRVVKVHAATTTLKKLLGYEQKVLGEEGWTVETPRVEDSLASAWAGVKAGKFDFPTIFGFIVAASQGEGYGRLLEGTDNELLGIPTLSEEEVQQFVEKAVGGDGNSAGW
ncbi:hypothetical protein GE09DRAFT_286440 [Coniochaeta sp. 2T2.1]|nr:hypothetical protein GE09DRAFT_286440 [Coniochaeta sp. 2T2.1]